MTVEGEQAKLYDAVSLSDFSSVNRFTLTTEAEFEELHRKRTEAMTRLRESVAAKWGVEPSTIRMHDCGAGFLCGAVLAGGFGAVLVAGLARSLDRSLE